MTEAGTQLDSRTVKRGALWTLAGFGAGQVVRFLSGIVLVRWVFLEADFGVAALVFGFLQGLMNFADLGLAASIVQNPAGHTREFRSTAWTLQALRGLLLAGLAWAVAPWAAQFYEEPLLAELIPYAAIGLCITSLGPTSYHVASRNLGLSRTVAVDLGTQVAAAALNIGWGLLDPRPHVLVWGAVASAVLRWVLIRALMGSDDRLAWHRPSLRAILQFGKWACLGSILTFASSQADRLIFGAMIPIAFLGVYAQAANLASIPTEVLGRLIVGVLFPVLSRRWSEQRLDHDFFARARRPVQALAGFVLACLCGAGPAAVGFLFPPNYADAGWMVQILAAGCWIGTALDGPRMWLLIASGHNRWSSFAAGCKLVGMVALLPLGHRLGGFPGAMVAYATADLLKYGASVWGCRQIGVLDLRTDGLMTVCFVAASGVAWLVHEGAMLASGSCFWTGLAVLAVEALLWLPFAAPLLRRKSAAGQDRVGDA